MLQVVVMKRAFIIFALVICLATGVFGIYVNVIEPVKKTIGSQGDVRMGTAGPGQTVVLVVERSSDGGNCPNNYCADGWDTIVPVKVPEGWVVEPSPIHETPMKMKIKVAPDAPNGEYNLTLAAIDEGNYDGLGNMTFSSIVTVSRDVIDISVDPTRVETGVGQPAIYNVKIANTGAASDPFEIKVREGEIPAWRFKKQVLVNYGSERVIPFEVVLNEEDERVFTLEVTSLSSPMIKEEKSLVISSKSNILTDWKATTHGLMLFPIIEEPIYAVIGLIGNLL